ncbi:MAG: exodeoxyribonuclease VII small subunit [Geodermatophilaceae bacterium]|nr:exodeoxyribonuclease VII small subunit [Geodermatophilaceae bacterium]
MPRVNDATEGGNPSGERIASASPSASPSYEQARDELAAIVLALEGGGQTLEQALTMWERGEVLASICQSWLDNARERLETVRARQTGATTETPPDG